MLFTSQDLPACRSKRPQELMEPLMALLNMEVCYGRTGRAIQMIVPLFEVALVDALGA